MREIKFRAWDTVFKKMIEVDSIDFFKGFVYYMEHDQWEREPLKNCILLQFTGLKDKNGKEIYEGDIVKDTPVKFNQKYEIIWKNCGFFIDNGYETTALLTPIFIREYQLEVIGNIYENKNLLKGGDK